MKPFLREVAKGVAVGVTVGAVFFGARLAFEAYRERRTTIEQRNGRVE